LSYCHQLWLQHDFHLKIVRPRSTKLGDYRFDARLKTHTITINSDLNPYHFLMVYLHEVAHYATFETYKNRVLPHGREWQLAFSNLMLPLIENSWVPDNLIKALETYIRKPKATSCADPSLLKVLRSFDPDDDLRDLGSLPLKTVFTFNGVAYQKLKTRRTRALCRNMSNGRNYLIALMARVRPEVDQSLLPSSRQS
jgi:hypothetical protein